MSIKNILERVERDKAKLIGFTVTLRCGVECYVYDEHLEAVDVNIGKIEVDIYDDNLLVIDRRIDALDIVDIKFKGKILWKRYDTRSRVEKRLKQLENYADYQEALELIVDWAECGYILQSTKGEKYSSFEFEYGEYIHYLKVLVENEVYRTTGEEVIWKK